MTIPTSVRKDEQPNAPPRPAAAAVVQDRVALIDPRTILIPDTPNRAEEAYSGEEHDQLVRSLLAAGENVQPIHVREVLQPDGTTKHVLVNGQRRLMACIDANLLVRATIEIGLGDLQAMLKRLHENRARQDLAPIDFGRQVKFVLESNASYTQRTLAKALGCSEALVSRAYDLARLPDDVIAAFPLASDLRYEDLKPLKDALKENAAAVLVEARRLKGEEGLSGRDVVKRLINAANLELAPCKSEKRPLKPTPVFADGKQQGEWCVGPTGALAVSISAPMSDAQRVALVHQVALFLERKVLQNKLTAKPDASEESTDFDPTQAKPRPRPAQ